jgi:hypothetical protein
MVIEARRVTPGRTVRGKLRGRQGDDSSAETSNLQLPDPAAPDQRTLNGTRTASSRWTFDVPSISSLGSLQEPTELPVERLPRWYSGTYEGSCAEN